MSIIGEVAGSSGEHTFGGGGRLVRKLAVVAAMLAVVSIMVPPTEDGSVRLTRIE